MIVGKAMTRHPQQTTSKPQQARPVQATLSTVGSTIASTSDLPTWAQTKGGSNTMQNQIASTEELPGWAKTQTHTSPKTHIKTDNIVAQAPVTASDSKKLINEGDPLIAKGAEDSGDSSATELGDEGLGSTTGKW